MYICSFYPAGVVEEKPGHFLGHREACSGLQLARAEGRGYFQGSRWSNKLTLKDDMDLPLFDLV